MKRDPKEPVFFVSCGIFKEELRYLLREKGLEGNILFLDAALHVNFDRLKSQLTGALEKNRNAGRIQVLYGHCHPEIEEILKSFGAKKLQARNCLEAIVGEEEIRRIDSEAKTFFLTAGWINNWERIFSAGEKDLGLDFGEMFRNYKRAMVFDTGVVPIDETKVEKFSRFTKLPVERRKITLEHLLKLIKSI